MINMRKDVVLANFSVVLLLVLQAHLISAATRTGQSGTNVTLVLNETLAGEPSNHYPVKVVLTSLGDAIQINFFAPYLGDDAVQRLHVFVANEDKHITELEFDKEKGSSSKTNLIVRLYWAPFNVLRKINTFAAKSQVVNETWSGLATLQVKFLPPKPSLINAAMRHQVEDDIHWDNFYSVTNVGIAIPDLMVLPRYKNINPSILSSETEYSSEWKSD